MPRAQLLDLRVPLFLGSRQCGLQQLVEAAGFRKIDQRIDEFGIFTVAMAERV